MGVWFGALWACPPPLWCGVVVVFLWGCAWWVLGFRCGCGVRVCWVVLVWGCGGVGLWWGWPGCWGPPVFCVGVVGGVRGVWLLVAPCFGGVGALVGLGGVCGVLVGWGWPAPLAVWGAGGWGWPVSYPCWLMKRAGVWGPMGAPLAFTASRIGEGVLMTLPPDFLWRGLGIQAGRMPDRTLRTTNTRAPASACERWDRHSCWCDLG